MMAVCAGAVVMVSLVWWAVDERVEAAEMALGRKAVEPPALMVVVPVEEVRAEDVQEPEPAEQVVVAPEATSLAQPAESMTSMNPTTVTSDVKPTPIGPRFDDRPIRPVRTIRMLVTAYSPDERSCGKWADNITASGYSVFTNGMKLVAADTRLLPFGSIVTVPGYDGGRPVPVLDRGGAIKGRRLDVLYPTHERALQWGSRWVEVTVWEYADGKGQRKR
jgi:3D (Asp-Asp-Asp) domain-containing protein